MLFVLIFIVGCSDEKSEIEKKPLQDPQDIVIENLADSVKIKTGPYIMASEESDFVAAEFPGGKNELEKFIKESMLEKFKTADTIPSGEVYIKFTVKKDGSLKKITISQELEGCPTCNEEALRIAKKMPKWNPAYEKINNGKGKSFYDEDNFISVKFRY